MKRTIVLVVIVAYLMQLTGCAIYLSHRFKPNEEPILADDVIRGVITQAGEEVRFYYKQGRRYSWIRSDSIHAYVKGKHYIIALDNVQELWVKRKDPTLSGLATMAVIIGAIFAICNVFRFDPVVPSGQVFFPAQTH